MKNLKEIRNSKLMTQKEVAEKLNITQATYSGYESGKYQPSIDILIAISKLFKVSIDYLVGNQNNFTIDMSDLPEIKKQILLYHLNKDNFDTLQEYRAIRNKQEWEEENPEKAEELKQKAIEEELKQKEWYEYKIKKQKENELKNKGNRND